jgi:ATPase subunit of ABC transporter with duplicated ATPase domains
MEDFTSNILFTCHDHQLTQTVATRVIELAPKGYLDKLIDFDDYLTDEKIKAQRDGLYK